MRLHGFEVSGGLDETGRRAGVSTLRLDLNAPSPIRRAAVNSARLAGFATWVSYRRVLGKFKTVTDQSRADR